MATLARDAETASIHNKIFRDQQTCLSVPRLSLFWKALRRNSCISSPRPHISITSKGWSKDSSDSDSFLYENSENRKLPFKVYSKEFEYFYMIINATSTVHIRMVSNGKYKASKAIQSYLFPSSFGQSSLYHCCWLTLEERSFRCLTQQVCRLELRERCLLIVLIEIHCYFDTK